MNDKPTLGLYAGSFDPFHIGHLDVVKQAADTGAFDVIMVAKGINSSKLVPGKVSDRFPLPKNWLATFHKDIEIKVDTYTTLLADYVKELENDYYNVTLIRGLRNGSDLQYEQNLVTFLKGMHPTIKVVFFSCDPKFQHISSSALRDIRHFSDAEYKKYVITD